MSDWQDRQDALRSLLFDVKAWASIVLDHPEEEYSRHHLGAAIAAVDEHMGKPRSTPVLASEEVEA